jgi:hypothetical protein
VELMKGSLNTFLNAFTYPDRTCYPVASCNLQARGHVVSRHAACKRCKLELMSPSAADVVTLYECTSSMVMCVEWSSVECDGMQLPCIIPSQVYVEIGLHMLLVS